MTGGHHIIHQMSRIRIGGQAVHAIALIGEEILCQHSIIEYDCVLPCLFQHLIQFLTGIDTQILGQFYRRTEGKEARGSLSVGKVAARCHKLTINVIIKILFIPEQTQFNLSGRQIQLLRQLPGTLSCPVIFPSGILTDRTHGTNLFVGVHVQIELHHFPCVIHHQANLGVLLITPDTGDLYCHFHVEPLFIQAFNISIQRGCLFGIHDQIGILARIRSHIQSRTA